MFVAPGSTLSISACRRSGFSCQTRMRVSLAQRIRLSDTVSSLLLWTNDGEVGRENFRNFDALSLTLTMFTSWNSGNVGFRWIVRSFPFN